MICYNIITTVLEKPERTQEAQTREILECSQDGKGQYESQYHFSTHDCSSKLSLSLSTKGKSRGI